MSRSANTPRVRNKIPTWFTRGAKAMLHFVETPGRGLQGDRLTKRNLVVLFGRSSMFRLSVVRPYSRAARALAIAAVSGDRPSRSDIAAPAVSK